MEDLIQGYSLFLTFMVINHQSLSMFSQLLRKINVVMSFIVT